MENCYEVLGVSEGSSDADIKSAYRSLARQFHPDSAYAAANPSEAKSRFLQISEAYEVLSDEFRRAQHDRQLRESREAPKRQARKALSLYQEGVDAYKGGDYEKAVSRFRKAVEGEPKNPLYCSWLGLAISASMGPERDDRLLREAKQWCEKATQLAPSHADYHVNLALIYRDAGLKTLALRSLEKALTLNPAHKRAGSWLTKLQEREETSLMDRLRGFLRKP